MLIKSLTLSLAFFACSASVSPAQDAPTAATAPPATAVTMPPSSSGAQTNAPRVFIYGDQGGNLLGVNVESVTRENMNNLNVSGEPRGVVVRDVLADSPAARAGLQKNDVILRFDGEAVSSAPKLQRLIREAAPAHTARITVSRGGAEQELSVTLERRAEAMPPSFESFQAPNMEEFRFNGEELKRNAEAWKLNTEAWKQKSEEWKKHSQELGRNSARLREQFKNFNFGAGGNFALVSGNNRRIGVTTQALTKQLADYFGVAGEGGLLVTSVDENSPAAKAGLRAGDVLTEVDGARLKTAGELSAALNGREEGEVNLTVTRDRKTRRFKVMPKRAESPAFPMLPDLELLPVPVTSLLAPRYIGSPTTPALPALAPPLSPLAAPTLRALPPSPPPARRVDAPPSLPQLAPVPPAELPGAETTWVL